MGVQKIGQHVVRAEDDRLLRGRGRYVSDMKLAGEAQAYVLRSPHAHAKITAIDTARAKAAPGVLAVLTGADIAKRGLGTTRPFAPRKRSNGQPAFVCPQPLLAHDRVRYVGDPIAFVVAETLDQAKDAAELIDIELRDAAGGDHRRRGAGAWRARGLGRESRQRSLLPRRRQQRRGRCRLRQGRASRQHNVVINRITANSMEPRGCLAQYDRSTSAIRSAARYSRCMAPRPRSPARSSSCRTTSSAWSATIWAAASA